MSQRVAWSRDQVAQGHPVTTVARFAQVSRQAIYKMPKPAKNELQPGTQDSYHGDLYFLRRR